MSETEPCSTCKAPATYAGTSDGLRIYTCTINPAHITRIKPEAKTT